MGFHKLSKLSFNNQTYVWIIIRKEKIMKELLYFCVLISSQFAFGQNPRPVLHFSFDGCLTDIGENNMFYTNMNSSNNYVTEQFSNSDITYVTSIANNENLYVEIPALFSHENDERTISIWLKIKTNKQWANFVNKDDVADNKSLGEITKSNHLILDPSAYTNPLNQAFEEQDLERKNIVITYSQTEGTRTYYNGKEIFQDMIINWNKTGDIFHLDVPIKWMPEPHNTTILFDDLKIYDLALNETQVLEEYLNELRLNDKTLASYSNFENRFNKKQNLNFDLETNFIFEFESETNLEDIDSSNKQLNENSKTKNITYNDNISFAPSIYWVLGDNI